MDPQALYGLLASHQYALFAALVIGFLVRILKSDTKLPLNVPPRLRIWVALGLGLSAGVLEKVAEGVPWKQALFNGVFAAVLAVLGQNVVIDSLRGGKEIPIPGLMVAGERPSPGKPPTIPPSAPPSTPSILGGMLLMISSLIAGIFLVGCLKAVKVAELVLDKAACVVQNQDLSNVEIFAKCAVQPGDIPRYQELLSESRAATRKALEQHKGDCK